MSIIRRQLAKLNLPQREETISLDRLKSLEGAAVMNSWTPGVPVTSIAAVPVPLSQGFMQTLQRAYESEPLRPV